MKYEVFMHESLCVSSPTVGYFQLLHASLRTIPNGSLFVRLKSSLFVRIFFCWFELAMCLRWLSVSSVISTEGAIAIEGEKGYFAVAFPWAVNILFQILSVLMWLRCWQQHIIFLSENFTYCSILRKITLPTDRLPYHTYNFILCAGMWVLLLFWHISGSGILSI